MNVQRLSDAVRRRRAEELSSHREWLHLTPNLTPGVKCGVKGYAWGVTDSTTTSSLRERTRRAVQAELIDVAQALFIERGYESVTVEQIAAAAGMSKRSFFRYFPSKDALVLGKYDRQGEDFAEALRARPKTEQPWTALRRMFDDVVTYISDPQRAERAAELDRIINASETLRAGYLERMQRAQRLIVDELVVRGGGSLSTLDASALVAAAFAAISTAHAHAANTTTSFSDALDATMHAIGNI
jgi:AcrR family transcriptional regulator